MTAGKLDGAPVDVVNVRARTAVVIVEGAPLAVDRDRLTLDGPAVGQGDPLAAACPWCGADPGDPCTVRAAHPTTGRGFTLALDYIHPDRRS